MSRQPSPAVLRARRAARKQGHARARWASAALFVGLAAGIVGTPALAGNQAPAPIDLAAGVHLFIDDYLIAYRQNVTRTVNPPAGSAPNPIITGLANTRQPAFNNIQYKSTVLRDPSTGQFRMWYTAYNRAQALQYTALAESANGIRWTPSPARVTGTHGLVLSTVYDEGPSAPVPAERYKAIGVPQTAPFWRPRLLYSADGLKWTLSPVEPVTPAEYGEVWEVFRDVETADYVALHRWNQPYEWVDTEGQPHVNSINDPGFTRLYALSRSEDFRTFGEARVIFAPDQDDSGETQFYSMSNVIRRGGYYLAMLNVLRDDLQAPGTPAQVDAASPFTGTVYGTGYTVLAWSRDGETWYRDRHTDPYLLPSPEPNAWDHAMAWVNSIVEVGDLVHLYYGGYQYGHKVFTDRQIGLKITERDHYVAQAAGEVPGLLRTPQVRFSADALTLNVAAPRGSARVRILDAAGKPLPGFGWGDCQPINTDAFEAPVRCRGQLRRLAGQTVQIEFRLVNARLFAFALTEAGAAAPGQ